MKKLKAVQIGADHAHAFAPINSLKKRDDIDFLGYVRLDGEKTTFAGVPELKYDDVLKMTDIDAVFIETEDKYLTDYAYEFIKRGIPVQMDKPGGQDKEAFDRLFDLAEEKNVPLHLGYMYRYNPAISRLSSEIASGALGKIHYVEAQMNCYHPPENKARYIKDYKGGMMNFLGCHLVDLVLRWQGVPDEVIPFNSATGDGGEDIGFAVFRYGNDHSLIRATAVEAGGFMRRQIVVCGEKGTVEINPTEYFSDVPDEIRTDTYVSMLAERGKEWGYRPERQVFVSPDRYDGMYDEFFRIVRGEIQNPYSYKYEKTLHDVLLKACGINIK
ncbi:MAG: Gfo/Idh/MocA family oxidoreductase [Clostridia bacterium]|nr:Gfo/Idh/MocA family oxidoreductase [Clostridia bacterium]